MDTVTPQQVIEVILGKELSSKEIVLAVQARYQHLNPDPRDIRAKLKTLLRSPLCVIAIGCKKRRRTYLLQLIDPEFSQRAAEHCAGKSRSRLLPLLPIKPGWNAVEEDYIQFVRDFDRLLREVRST